MDPTSSRHTVPECLCLTFAWRHDPPTCVSIPFQRVAIQTREERNRHSVAERLSCMAGTLGVRNQLAHLVSRRRARDHEGNGDLLEVGWSVVHVVLLGVAEGGTHISGRIGDGYLVQWREPRQLGKESEGDAYHEVLQGRWTEIRSAARDRLIGLHGELAHAPFEMDVLDDPRYCACCDGRLIGWQRIELRAQAPNLAHLLVEINPASLFGHRSLPSKTLSALTTWARMNVSLTNWPPGTALRGAWHQRSCRPDTGARSRDC